MKTKPKEPDHSVITSVKSNSVSKLRKTKRKVSEVTVSSISTDEKEDDDTDTIEMIEITPVKRAKVEDMDEDFDGESVFEAPVKKGKGKGEKLLKARSEKAKNDADISGGESGGVAPAKKAKLKVEKVTAVKPKTVKKESVDGKVVKKEKLEKVDGDAAVELLVQYLRETNRPYSATDVSMNLHGKIPKSKTDKLLKELMEQGRIEGKATSSKGNAQWVYWCKQDPGDSATPEELAAMDLTIANLRTNVPILKTNAKNLNTKLAMLRSLPTTTELLDRIKTMNSDKVEKEAKLQAFKDGKVMKVEPKEKERVDKEWILWGRKRAARKRCFAELEGLLLDGMTKEEIWEKAGIEGDED